MCPQAPPIPTPMYIRLWKTEMTPGDALLFEYFFRNISESWLKSTYFIFLYEKIVPDKNP